MNKKRSPFFRTLTYVYKYNQLASILSIIMVILTAALAVVGSSMTGTLFDNYLNVERVPGGDPYNNLSHYIWLLCLIYGLSLFAYSAYTNIMMYVTQNTMKRLRDQLFVHMESLPISYFDKNSHGNIMSRFTNDIDTLRQMISQSLPMLISTVVSSLASLTFMFFICWPLAFVAIGVLILMISAVFIINKKSRKYFGIQQGALGSLNGYINEMINGQKVVKVFCHETKAIADFEKLNNELYENGKNANIIANLAMPILFNIGLVSYVIIMFLGAFVSIKFPKLLSLGELVAFLILLRSLTNPIAQASQQLNLIVMSSVGSKRIFDLLDTPSEFDEGYVHLINVKYENNQLVETNELTNHWAWKHPHQNGEVELVKVRGDVRFFDVDFGYEPSKLVLHDVSLFAKPGQKIAFVGATGAGKTTITNLINRFYDIQDGKIRIDGININKICKNDLRRALGMVLQDTSLFTGTIKDNIKFGKLDATDEEIINASKLSNADAFIQLLPNGYETVISGDGGSLSQGQRQLLSIARAAISNPPILILDEATSSIDTRTEKLVQEGMDRIMKDRTVFVIAHRLSTIKNAQAIMVLEHGRIIERGNHEELINQHGQYYQLYTGAFELE